MEIVRVHLKNHSYLIKIGSKLFSFDNIFSPLKSGCKIMLVTNITLNHICKKIVLDYLLKLGFHVDEFVFPDGEEYKNLNSVDLLLSELLKKMHDRHSVLVALGGGVIGDLTGFVASIYQRGISFIQIPTTLLSQVDAAIGGKTGVNHILGKNMIGSFWQPQSVIINLDFLRTLPYNQLASGLSEVIKYAISFDMVFFEWLEKNLHQILSLNIESLMYCIKRCCELKANIVSNDEREKNLRVLLNLGHTYGHAIESYFNYQGWLHGESVSVGIVMACTTSEILGLMKKYDVNRVIKLLKRCELPVQAPCSMKVESYFPYMQRDKKNHFGKIRLVLPISIGKVKIFNDINHKVIESAILQVISI
ncbi:3-dehydroquinate synthase [Buchnera aphidicola]|uniref:3-dehydroquinate synthase n=1 Tax=Buchnera aphidicola TaxID=9 RepID=UPI0034639FED